MDAKIITLNIVLAVLTRWQGGYRTDLEGTVAALRAELVAFTVVVKPK